MEVFFVVLKVWEKDYPLRIYEVSSDGRIPLPGLLNFFQDAASGHAAHLGVGLSQLEPRGLSWFVTRIHMKIRRYPVYGETIRLVTWPKSKKRLFALRDFEMFVGQEPVAAGSSVWCLIDLAARTPRNVNETLPGLPENPRHALDTGFPRISLPDNFGGARFFSPRKSEIDMNGHVNNAVTISWALESLPDFPERHNSVSEIAAFFRHEIGAGQEVTSQVAFGDAGGGVQSYHHLTERENGREVLRMKLSWNEEPFLMREKVLP